MPYPLDGERGQREASRRFSTTAVEAIIKHTHIRFHAAAVLSLAFIALLTFLLLPVHRVHVDVDGTEKTLLSRQQGSSAVLEQARVELLPGDSVHESRRAGERVLAVERAVPVELEVDGRTLAWRTRAQTISGVLAEAGARLGPFDTVAWGDLPVSIMDPVKSSPRMVASKLLRLSLPAGISNDDGEPLRISIRRAVPFRVIEDGTAIDLASSEPTVGLALHQRGIRVGPGDLVSPSASSPLTPGLEVRIERARRIDLSLPDFDTVIFTQADTVDEVLSEAGVDVEPSERVDPPRAAPVADDMEVNVLAVSEERYLESETVYHGTSFDVDASLPPGGTRKVEGQDGTLYREYVIRYENGAETGRELVDEWYDPPPQDTVVYEGPGIEYRASGGAPDAPDVPDAPDAPGALGTPAAPDATEAVEVPNDLDVASTMNVCATWYNAVSAGKAPGSPGYGITATGVPLTKGIVAVDPSVIPLGTRMYIPGYGFGVAADTGGAIVGNLIDLGYPDDVVGDWGSTRCLDIYILNP